VEAAAKDQINIPRGVGSFDVLKSGLRKSGSHKTEVGREKQTVLSNRLAPADKEFLKFLSPHTKPNLIPTKNY